MSRYVGVMPGTRMHAVDAAVVDLGRPAPRSVAGSANSWHR
jgi:1,6-anhydro-N-acetylmuramate kinase